MIRRKICRLSHSALFTIGMVTSICLIAGCSQKDSSDSTNNQQIAEEPVSSYLPDCSASAKSTSALPTTVAYRVINKYRHDSNAFTQGFVYADGWLYESTGLYGQSTLRAQPLDDLSASKVKKIDSTLFGEGLALANNQLIQLTWKSGKVLRYDADELSLLGEDYIEGEGWGLTNNASQLISSDGSANITLRNFDNLAPERVVQATFAGRPLQKLNELEWIGNCLYANIWLSDTIAVIDINSGASLFSIDLSPIAQIERQGNRERATNGIAYRQDTHSILVTGKNWHWVYEIVLLEP